MVEVVLERAVVDPDVLGLLDGDEVGGGLGEGEGETLDDNVLDFFHHEPSGGETVLATLVGREDGLREKKRRRQRAVGRERRKEVETHSVGANFDGLLVSLDLRAMERTGDLSVGRACVRR